MKKLAKPSALMNTKTMKNGTNSLYLIGLLILLTLFTSCNTVNNEKEIKNLVHQIYKEPDPYRNFEVTDHFFSKNLETLVLEAKQVEKNSIENIPEDERSTIKPHILEGDIFSSLYEGYESYAITKTSLKKDTALVELKFTNKLFGTSQSWTDELIIVDKNGWKLDNVIYKKDDSNSKNLKNVLSNFIKAYKENN
ncbi:hypothetical protein N9Y48_03625 [Zobellia sp.]|nr:hypothetical protein [Zobellia sp.]